MSVVYLVAFDENKALQKTKYVYKDSLKNQEMWADGQIIFEDNLYPQEEDIARHLFQ